MVPKSSKSSKFQLPPGNYFPPPLPQISERVRGRRKCEPKKKFCFQCDVVMGFYEISSKWSQNRQNRQNSEFPLVTISPSPPQISETVRGRRKCEPKKKFYFQCDVVMGFYEISSKWSQNRQNRQNSSYPPGNYFPPPPSNPKSSGARGRVWRRGGPEAPVVRLLRQRPARGNVAHAVRDKALALRVAHPAVRARQGGALVEVAAARAFGHVARPCVLKKNQQKIKNIFIHI